MRGYRAMDAGLPWLKSKISVGTGIFEESATGEPLNDGFFISEFLA